MACSNLPIFKSSSGILVESASNPKQFQKFYSKSIKLICCDLCLQKKEMFFVVCTYESNVALITYFSTREEIFCILEFHNFAVKFAFNGLCLKISFAILYTLQREK